MRVGESLSYVLDPQDCIARVGDGWDRCALAQGAAELCRVSVVGTSLWSHIHDPMTAELYRLILARVREGQTVAVPYNGSSPGMRRDMRLHLRPVHDGHVECTASVVRAETLVPGRGEASVTPVDLARLRVCSWCHRILVDRTWCEPDEAVATLRLFFQPVGTSLSHGLCSRCAGDLGSSPLNRTRFMER